MEVMNLWIQKNKDNVDQLIDSSNEVEEAKRFDQGKSHRGLSSAAHRRPEILFKPLNYEYVFSPWHGYVSELMLSSNSAK